MIRSAFYALALRDQPRPAGPPSEAELRAIDRSYAIAKQMGVLDRLRDARALQQQIKEEPLL